ncbi:alpha-N-arab-like proteininofuranosidase [Apiospora marii]|uniref:Alpha-N-arab-like proteininofuranosidase n=1 Tax=Apiospora marii TaxID=335849 RepID=A0ABR1RJI1_9PEZI
MKSVILTGLLALASHAGLCTAQNFDPNKAAPQNWDLSKIGTDKKTNATFSNPVSTENIGDPFMTKYTSDGQDWYLYTFSTNDNITLKRSRSLTDNWDDAETRVVFKPNATGADAGKPWSTSIWAPEIHNISGKWYIIFTATPDGDNPPPLQDAICPINCPAVNHRMFVLESTGSDPWTSDFPMKSMLDTYDQFAIDGTYFSYKDKLYHIYSCWENAYSAWPANLCITEMSDPWTVSSSLSERQIVSFSHDEKDGHGTPKETTALTSDIDLDPRPALGTGALRPTDPAGDQRGPAAADEPQDGPELRHLLGGAGQHPYYCLGMLELVGNDPMQYQSWRKHKEGCVFHQNTQAGVYGTGHASFTTSPDGKEDYIVYHAQTTANPVADLYRTARIQKFGWNADGTPNFPLAENGPFPVPAGQKERAMAK